MRCWHYPNMPIWLWKTVLINATSNFCIWKGNTELGVLEYGGCRKEIMTTGTKYVTSWSWFGVKYRVWMFIVVVRTRGRRRDPILGHMPNVPLCRWIRYWLGTTGVLAMQLIHINEKFCNVDYHDRQIRTKSRPHKIRPHDWSDFGPDGCNQSAGGIIHGTKFRHIRPHRDPTWGAFERLIRPHWDVTSVRICRGPPWIGAKKGTFICRLRVFNVIIGPASYNDASEKWLYHFRDWKCQMPAWHLHKTVSRVSQRAACPSIGDRHHSWYIVTVCCTDYLYVNAIGLEALSASETWKMLWIDASRQVWIKWYLAGQKRTQVDTCSQHHRFTINLLLC